MAIVAARKRHDFAMRESAGLGVMELVGPTALEATWHYTAAKSAAATQFVHAFQALRPPASRRKTAKQQRLDGRTDLPVVRREDRTAANGLRSVHAGGRAAARSFAVATRSFRAAARRDDRSRLRAHAREHGRRLGSAVYHDSAAGQRA